MVAPSRRPRIRDVRRLRGDSSAGRARGCGSSQGPWDSADAGLPPGARGEYRRTSRFRPRRARGRRRGAPREDTPCLDRRRAGRDRRRRPVALGRRRRPRRGGRARGARGGRARREGRDLRGLPREGDPRHRQPLEGLHPRPVRLRVHRVPRGRARRRRRLDALRQAHRDDRLAEGLRQVPREAVQGVRGQPPRQGRQHPALPGQPAGGGPRGPPRRLRDPRSAQPRPHGEGQRAVVRQLRLPAMPREPAGAAHEGRRQRDALAPRAPRGRRQGGRQARPRARGHRRPRPRDSRSTTRAAGPTPASGG
jgi:hypothetical protein